jgi:hypothetical protein
VSEGQFPQMSRAQRSHVIGLQWTRVVATLNYTDFSSKCPSLRISLQISIQIPSFADCDLVPSAALAPLVQEGHTTATAPSQKTPSVASAQSQDCGTDSKALPGKANSSEVCASCLAGRGMKRFCESRNRTSDTTYRPFLASMSTICVS